MAKVYEINESKNGSLGGMVYYQNAGRTITRKKAEKINDAKTIEQVEQRSRMQNSVKAFNQIGSKFLQKCFKKRGKGRSFYNEFVAYNAIKNQHAYPFFLNYSKDDKIIGIGRFVISKGRIPSIPVKTFAVGDDTFYGIEVDDTIAVDGNATVAAVSTSLVSMYPQIFSEGRILNGLGIQNVGVKYQNDNDPLVLEDDYHIVKVMKNFVLSKTDTAKVFEKGFCVVEGTDNKHYLTLAYTATEANHVVANQLDNPEGIGYCGFLVAYKNGTNVEVSTCNCSLNKELSDLLMKIDSDPIRLANGWLSTLMKVLIVISYGVQKTIEIVRDWPI